MAQPAVEPRPEIIFQFFLPVECLALVSTAFLLAVLQLGIGLPLGEIIDKLLQGERGLEGGLLLPAVGVLLPGAGGLLPAIGAPAPGAGDLIPAAEDLTLDAAIHPLGGVVHHLEGAVLILGAGALVLEGALALEGALKLEGAPALDQTITVPVSLETAIVMVTSHMTRLSPPVRILRTLLLTQLDNKWRKNCANPVIYMPLKLQSSKEKSIFKLTGPFVITIMKSMTRGPGRSSHFWTA